jgi:hypothetical protein
MDIGYCKVNIGLTFNEMDKFCVRFKKINEQTCDEQCKKMISNADIGDPIAVFWCIFLLYFVVKKKKNRSSCGNAAETSKKSRSTASKAKIGLHDISYMLVSFFHYIVFVYIIGNRPTRILLTKRGKVR